MTIILTAMLQTCFVCADAAGGLALLEKMMDALGALLVRFALDGH
jgi:hypothetical protein